MVSAQRQCKLRHMQMVLPIQILCPQLHEFNSRLKRRDQLLQEFFEVRWLCGLRRDLIQARKMGWLHHVSNNGSSIAAIGTCSDLLRIKAALTRLYRRRIPTALSSTSLEAVAGSQSGMRGHRLLPWQLQIRPSYARSHASLSLTFRCWRCSIAARPNLLFNNFSPAMEHLHLMSMHPDATTFTVVHRRQNRRHLHSCPKKHYKFRTPCQLSIRQ